MRGSWLTEEKNMFPLLGSGWIETSLTVYLVQFFRLGVVRLKVMVLRAMLEKCPDV